MKHFVGLFALIPLLSILVSYAPPARAAENVLSTNPHPILQDLAVRKAIAFCTNKDALLAAYDPELSPTERAARLMDSFLPPQHWGYHTPATQYAYDPAAGGALLETAGWTLPAGQPYRVKNGAVLTLSVSTTTAAARQAYMAVFIQQMAACGIRVINNPLAPEDFFSPGQKLGRGDFEMAGFAWMFGTDLAHAYEADGGLTSMYGCGSDPTPAGQYQDGQNFNNWCNETATQAMLDAANMQLPEATRLAAYHTAQDLFAADMPELPYSCAGMMSMAMPTNISR